jgi:hypothetical protein
MFSLIVRPLYKVFWGLREAKGADGESCVRISVSKDAFPTARLSSIVYACGYDAARMDLYEQLSLWNRVGHVDDERLFGGECLCGEL